MKYVILFLTVLCAFQGASQNSVDFEQIDNYYLKGGSLIYGNNILSKHYKRPFNSSNALNDNIKMTYVDVDDDPNTFSSSAVQITIPENSKIVNAILYWSGTYPGDRGIKKRQGNRLNYVIDEEVSQEISSVKLKVNNRDYENINGEIVFDSANATDEILVTNMPYVCKANVTKYLEGNIVDAQITVANVPAAQGFINGGSTAGWLLFIVYENSNHLPHFITSYDGFQIVKNKKVEVNIKDFKSAQLNNAPSRITIGALDGDSPLEKDRVEVYNVETNKKEYLNSKTRLMSNFFNSSIDHNKNEQFKRFPNSKNTLGFDIAQVDVRDEKGVLIPKNTENLNLIYSTKADSFYVFFTSFQTQIDQEYLDQIDQEKLEKDILFTDSDTIQQEVETSDKETPVSEPVEKDLIVTVKVSETAVIQETKQQEITTTITNSSGLKGYYIITNVFSNTVNAVKWKLLLKKEGYAPDSFIDPVNGLEYVYIAFQESEFLLQDLLDQARQNDLLKDSWIKKME